MPPKSRSENPWRRAPVGELSEPLLPRWFVLVTLVAVPVALVVFLVAFPFGRVAEHPVAERRPPPAGDHNHGVGAVAVGPTDPQPWEPACAPLEGVHIAGEAPDVAVLGPGLEALCDLDLPSATAAALASFAEQGGVVRFAVFEITGVDSVGDRASEPPRILVNARFTTAEPQWIAPLVVHDAVMLAGVPERADTAVGAREAELWTCGELFDEDRPRGCGDAEELLDLPDPPGALRAAGYE